MLETSSIKINHVFSTDMITLIVHREEQKTTHSFTKESIIIGSHDAADLSLSSESLLPEHVNIFKEGGQWIAINLANDPEITINGHSFHYQALAHRDHLMLHGIEISFQVEPDLEAEEFDVEAELKKLDPILQSGTPDLSHFDIEALLKEINLPPKNSSPISQRGNEEEEVSYRVFKTNEQEDIELLNISRHNSSPFQNDLADEKADGSEEDRMQSTARIRDFKMPSPKAKISLNRFIAIAIILLAMTGVLGAGAFITISSLNLDHQRNASQGVADLAMALYYAKLSGQAPPENNWSDAEFIEDNLQSVLPSKYRVNGHLSSSIQFINCPYIVSIASNPNNRSFLIAAIPTSSPLQWFVPKKSLFVDSETMTLYSTREQAELEKTLKSKATGTINEKEEMDALKVMSRAVSLNNFHEESSNLGFTPPQSLAGLKPGAQFYIYNAPRYYKMSRMVIETASQLAEKPLAARDEAFFTELLDLFHSSPDWIFYCSQGREMASKAEKGLKTYAPSQNFLVAYLAFNHDDGLIANSYLLQDSPSNSKEESKINTAVQTQIPLQIYQRERLSPEVISSHPLFESLSGLNKTRRFALMQAGNEITQILDRYSDNSINDFHHQLQEALENYSEIDQKQKIAIATALESLYRQYSKEQIDFFAYVEKAGLISYLPTSLHAISEDRGDLSSRNNVASVLSGIQESQNLTDLNRLVNQAAVLLGTDQIASMDQRHAFEEDLRNATINKLNEFLTHETHSREPDGRHMVLAILNNVGVSQEEQRNYLIKQFDRLLSKQPPADIQEASQPKTNLENSIESAIHSSTISGHASKEELASVGIDLLNQERAQVVSSARDEKLERAANLIAGALEENISYWQNVLEARELLILSSKQQILAVLNKELEYPKHASSIPAEILVSLEAYSSSLQLGNQEQQTLELTQILTLSQRIETLSDQLSGQYDRFVERLQIYLHDYDQAKAIGFFPTNQKIHTKNLATLRRMLKNATDLKPKFAKMISQLHAAGHGYGMLVKKEMEHPHQKASTGKSVLEVEISNIEYPTSMISDIANRLQKQFEFESSAK